MLYRILTVLFALTCLSLGACSQGENNPSIQNSIISAAVKQENPAVEQKEGEAEKPLPPPANGGAEPAASSDASTPASSGDSHGDWVISEIAPMKAAQAPTPIEIAGRVSMKEAPLNSTAASDKGGGPSLEITDRKTMNEEPMNVAPACDSCS